ncbi:hypothetical protein A0256_19370 [Mucilaginibacter sp. PAMC 26640]|nr:hypothetical protein A0256_19370 [Mucilaginibacter sp. PAMC 26640]
MVPDPLHELILQFIQQTNRPIFLTGKAGTGKTTFLRYVKSNITKNLAIVAPTAVAAINAGGVTIHSFFQIPFGPQVPNNGRLDLKQLSQEKANILRCLDLLIIDEISMVRADTLDYIDAVLRQAKGSVRPFGGVQLLMIGDLFQLPPVYEKDWHILKSFYAGPYFFQSLAFRQFPVLTFELTKVYRQKDPLFVDILNQIRNGEASNDALLALNARYDANLNANWLKDYVTLSTHNKLVSEINQSRLSELDGEAITFKATVSGDFPKEGFPAEEELVLKVGAQVMFIKNDSSGKKQYYNGRTARVTAISQNSIRLTFLDDDSEFEAVAEQWTNVGYALSASEQKVNESENGSFTQYPLRLAWAITIHKSQGLTFDKAIIDVDAAFAFGQAYVALSRCRTMGGMILKAPVRPENIRTDPSIIRFMENAVTSAPDRQLLENTIKELELETLKDIFDFSILHAAWLQLSQMWPPGDALLHTTNFLQKDISAVGDRFNRRELVAIPVAADRLKQAAAYFVPKLNAFAADLNSNYQNNKDADLPAEFYEALNFVLVNLKTKTAAFMRLPIATKIDEVLSSMQEAGIGYKPVYKNWNAKALPKEKEIINPEVYQKLVQCRLAESAARKVLEYNLLSDNTLRDIAAKLPRGLKELSQVKGVGDVKATDFGDTILKLIRSHLGESNLFG